MICLVNGVCEEDRRKLIYRTPIHFGSKGSISNIKPNSKGLKIQSCTLRWCGWGNLTSRAIKKVAKRLNMDLRRKMHQKVTKPYLTETRFIFYCHIKIKIPDSPYAESIIDRCFDILRSVDERYNSYQDGSHFDIINKNAGNWVVVDDITISMLRDLEKIRALTNGVYNIQVMSMLRAWGFYRDEGRSLPEPSLLELLVNSLKVDQVLIRGNQVKISVGSELITGSFIKAYAVDKVVDFLKGQGITDAVINAGGSSIFALNDTEHPSWKINIPHPSSPDGRWFQIDLSNRCLSISGRQSNYITIEKKEYSHILNACTGYPSSNRQVVAITQSAFLGDVVSTALMANDTDKAAIKNIQEAFSGQLRYYVVPEIVPNSLPSFTVC